jgi:hypothetical protein
MSCDVNAFADPSVRNTPKAQRIRSVFGAAARERDYRTLGQDWTQIELHFVNEACIERLAEHFAAPLHQHARYTSLT